MSATVVPIQIIAVRAGIYRGVPENLDLTCIAEPANLFALFIERHDRLQLRELEEKGKKRRRNVGFRRRSLWEKLMLRV